MNSITLSEKEEKRFWSFVDIRDSDDCWEWQGASNGTGNGCGHGRFCIRVIEGKSLREYSHRISWMLKFGDIPEGMSVLHKCDNPPCCNWKHLFLGTQKDNMQDASRKGRCVTPNLKGEEAYQAKLKEKDVLEIKRLLAEEKVSQSQIARNYNVSLQAIHLIKKGRNWAWLK